MNSRSAAAAIVVALAVCFTTGCTPQAEPEPTATTGFATDAEAFAAAEKTYRLYVDALNERRRDPAAGANPQDFLAGEALETDIETQRQLAAEGMTVVGETIIASFGDRSISSTRVEIELAVCLDSSETRVLRGDEDVTPTDRTVLLPLDVTLVSVGGDLRISSSESSESSQC